jgi:hypothetical protein
MKQIFLIFLFIALGCSSPTPRPTSAHKVVENPITKWTLGWEKRRQHLVEIVWKKYGEPQEKTSDMLIWKSPFPFKRIVIYRNGADHEFPYHHHDVIEHVVNYRIPINRSGELTQFNGSVVFDRTRGELSVTGDLEQTNLLALNLAHDILSGTKNHSLARKVFTRKIESLLRGNADSYGQKLLFAMGLHTADPDQSTLRKIPQAQKANSNLKKAEREEFTE